MTAHVTRHQFLSALHELLKPKTYLEVGVQYGASLELAIYSELAVGVDPQPLRAARGNEIIFSISSGEYFANVMVPTPINLAFIDGSHLYEDALHDFVEVSKRCDARSVVVFDDVLPYNQAIAAREMPPGGDWTGDVWKVWPTLYPLLADGAIDLVDTFPTGTMVVYGFNGYVRASIKRLERHDDPIQETVAHYLYDNPPVPDDVINRTRAKQPEQVLQEIRERLCASQ